jgi:ribokinase
MNTNTVMDPTMHTVKPVITIVGSVNMDLVFRCERMPGLGETITGREFYQIPGGKGANQAVAAARMGAEVRLLGRVGDDDFGTRLRGCLAADGIDISNLGTVAGIATGVAGIMVDDAGQNSIVVAPGANAALTVDDVEAMAAAIGGAQLLICQLETPLETVVRAIDIAKRSALPVIFNPTPVRDLSDVLLAKVDYLIVNEVEATQLSHIAVTDEVSARLAAQKLLARGAGAVLLTMGEHGVCIAQADGCSFIPAVKVEVVDTTAAGDTFVGAFAVGLAHGLDVVAAGIQAQYAAALSVTKLGAQTSIPQRAEVDALIRRRTAAQ